VALDRHKTIREALNYVADNPGWPPDEKRLNMEIWEYVARNLYDIATNVDTRVVGSVARATRAQKIIYTRTAGTRRAGTAPAVKSAQKVNFKPLGSDQNGR